MTNATFGGAETAADDIYATADGGSSDSKTVYEALSAALSKEAQRELLTLSVPARPGVSMRFDPTIEFELYNAWVDKASKGTKRKDGNPDYLKLAVMVISHTNRAILFHGKESMADNTGDVLTIAHPEIHAKLGVQAGMTGTAIRRLYGSDGHAIQAMQKIISAAGYSLDGDVDEEDEDNSPLE